MKHKFVAQMYSVRKDFEKDCEGTIKKLKEIGFDGVQVDGMRGHDKEEVARLLKKYDLKVVGMHIKHDRFMNDIDGIVEEAYLFDCKTVFDKYIEDEEQHEEGYRKTRKALVEAARKLSPLGFRIGLHNPEYDFNNEVDGKRIMDYITEPDAGTIVYPELDTYWVSVAGHDPLEYMKKYSGRMPIMHLKDIRAELDVMDFPANLAELGRGSIDFKEVLRWGEANGVEYYAIEQDASEIGMFESMKISLDHLIKVSEELANE